MLNRELYNRLRTVFKNVHVQYENVQPKLRLLRWPKLVNGQLREWEFDSRGSGETYQVNCPVCGDKKGHCYISALSFTRPRIGDRILTPAPLLIHCFRRNCFSGNPEAREALTQVLKSSTPMELDVGEEDCFSGAQELQQDIHRNTEANLLKWQPDYHPIEHDAPAEVLDYVARRGIQERDIKELKIGWGRCWNYKKQNFIGNSNWLQFPIIDQAGLRGFQSRQLHSDGNLKYFFDTRTPKKMCLYNRERASSFHIVAIAEGIIDALHIGRCGMAFFGFEPSKAQVRLLQQDGAKLVLYIPDQKKHYTADGVCDLDPPKIADTHIEQWRRQHLFEWGCYRIDVPRADAGECTTAEIWDAVVKQLAYKYKVDDCVLEVLFKQLERI